MKGRVALAWALVGLVITGVGVVAWIDARPGSATDIGVSPALIAACWAITGALLLTARPGNTVGWLLVLSGMLQIWSNVGSAYGGYGVAAADPMWPLADWVAQSASFIYFPSLILPVTVIVALYPDGRLPSSRWRLPVTAVVAGLTLVTVAASLDDSAYDDIAPGSPPLQVDGGWWGTAVFLTAFGLLIGGTLAIWAMTGFRLARAVPPERSQLAWYAATVVPCFLVAFYAASDTWVVLVFGLSIPVAIAVGVLRYRMLDIVLRPAIVYGSLTLIVVAVFVGVTALAGSALDRGPVPGVIAAALVAVGLTPVRERVQRGADRFVYGDRRDPLRAVATIGDRVASANDESMLGAVVASVADAVRAPAVSVVDPLGQALADHGVVVGDAERLPLVVAGRPVGTLLVAPRGQGTAYNAADQRVMSALAPQVAVVVYALDLADALEAQRDRVVAATRVERDRLRRELHDGLGPSLSGTALGLHASSDALASGQTDSVQQLLERMKTEVDTAVVEVRRIIDGLRPADLDEGGLGLAVRRRAAVVAATIAVDVSVDPLPELTPDVETAAYRIAGEALTNVARHAGAQRAHVAVAAADGELTLRVADDGTGIAEDATAGIGLASMRRRAESVGGTLDLDSDEGGTTVTARLPL